VRYGATYILYLTISLYIVGPRTQSKSSLTLSQSYPLKAKEELASKQEDSNTRHVARLDRAHVSIFFMLLWQVVTHTMQLGK